MRQLFADGVTLSSNSTFFKAIASTAILWPFRSAPTNASLISSNVLTISRSRLISSSFLIIDDEVYHLGASLNELGKRLFAFSRLHMDKEIIMRSVISNQ